MTDEEKCFIRENTTMKICNFYLDDLTKLEVLQKLKALGLSEERGVFSALIRSLLQIFASGEFADLDPLVKETIKKEYVLTIKKNRRSKL